MNGASAIYLTKWREGQISERKAKQIGSQTE